MRDFTKINLTLWQDQEFRELECDEPRYLYLYFLTNPHQNSAGAFALPEGYACADLNWSAEKFRTNRDALVDVGQIKFEPDSNEYQILGWFDHNPLMNPKHVAGAKRLAEKLQSSELREKVLRAIEAHTPGPTTQQTRFGVIHR